MPAYTATPSRSCGECLYRNPSSGWCPRRDYVVDAEEAACACFAVPFKLMEKAICRYPSRKAARKKPSRP